MTITEQARDGLEAVALVPEPTDSYGPGQSDLPHPRPAADILGRDAGLLDYLGQYFIRVTQARATRAIMYF